MEDYHTYYVSEQKVLVHNTCANEFVNTSWYNIDGSINYPPNDGAVLGTEKVVTLKEGMKIGRYGDIRTTNDYVTSVNTPPEKLSLPPWTDPNIYTEFIVMKNIPNVIKSIIVPWGGSSGGGTQYKVPRTIKYLLNEGFIKQIEVR